MSKKRSKQPFPFHLFLFIKFSLYCADITTTITASLHKNKRNKEMTCSMVVFLVYIFFSTWFAFGFNVRKKTHKKSTRWGFFIHSMKKRKHWAKEHHTSYQKRKFVVLCVEKKPNDQTRPRNLLLVLWIKKKLVQSAGCV